METADPVRVEVCHALPGRQTVIAVELAPGATVEEAILRSGILARHPVIDLQADRVGVHGKLCRLDRVVADGDRVEIYRPLQGDPKAIRRRLAAQGKVMGKS